MSKFSGKIGYSFDCETAPGVWEDSIVERFHKGDTLQYYRNSQSGDKLVDDYILNNKVSIILDPFLNDNLDKLRYIVINGLKWKISNIEIQRPRIIITTGGLYRNGH